MKKFHSLALASLLPGFGTEREQVVDVSGSETFDRIGLSAATGGSDGEHSIRNVEICQ